MRSGSDRNQLPVINYAHILACCHFKRQRFHRMTQKQTLKDILFIGLSRLISSTDKVVVLIYVDDALSIEAERRLLLALKKIKAECSPATVATSLIPCKINAVKYHEQLCHYPR